MPFYLNDTDILSLFRVGHLEVVRRVGLCLPGEVVTSVVTIDEHLSG